MKQAEAEEFTAALGQVMGGGYRLILHAQRQGVPEALDMTLDEWVKRHLGGYVRMSIDERREAAKELAEEGMSQRDIGNVLGISNATVSRALGVTNVTPSEKEPSKTGSNEPTSVTNVTPNTDAEIDAEEVDPSDPETYIVSRETGEVLDGANGNQRTKEDVEQTERMAIDTIERRIQGPDGDEMRRTALVAQYSTVVYTVMGKLVPLDPDVTARAIGDRQGTDRFIEQTRDWLDRFEVARKRTGTIHELKRKDMTS